MSLVQAKARDLKQQEKQSPNPDYPKTCAGDADLWSVEPEGKIYLEVVIKVTKNRRQSVDVARELFANEVVKCIDSFNSHRRWIPLEVSVDSCVNDLNAEPENTSPITVYPHTKNNGPSGENGLPHWATQSFMTSLCVKSEAVAECAVLLGQEIDDSNHFIPDTQYASSNRTSVGPITVSESTMIANQLEAKSPHESFPKMYPALLENFKDICGVSKVSHRNSVKAESEKGLKEDPSEDKWWGGGEGWRGTETDIAHDMDPTAREAHRSNVFSSAAQRVQACLGLREETPRVYVPCQVRFSLICYSASETSEATCTGNNQTNSDSNSSDDPISKLGNVRSIFKEAARKTMIVANLSPQGLVIGGGKVISRLIGSTIWLSSDSAMAVWSCIPLNESISMDKHTRLVKAIFEAESKFKLKEAQNFFASEPPDYVRGCCFAGLSVSLSKDGKHFGELFPDVVRMRESMAYRARALEDILSMLRMMLDRPRSGYGDCLAFTNIEALTCTLVFHVSLSMRLLVSSSQCIHFVGGQYLVLLLVHKLEKILQLGHYSLSAGMRYGYDICEPNVPWKLPIPVLDKETIKEMRDRRVVIDGTTGLRRAIAAGGDVFAEVIEIIVKLEGICKVLAPILSNDVNECCRATLTRYIPQSADNETSEQEDTSILAKRMEKRSINTKKVAFTEPEKDLPENKEESKPEDMPSSNFDAESSAFLDAIQESLLLPSERKQAGGGAHLDDEEGIPAVLIGRSRVVKSKRSYAGDEITMLDNLRNFYS